MQTTASGVPQYCFWLMIVSIAIGGLAGLAVADDQLALAAADRDHASMALMPVCSGSVHRLPLGDARGDDVDLAELGRSGSGGPSSSGAAERIDHAAEQRSPDRHFEQAAGGLDRVAFLHLVR